MQQLKMGTTYTRVYQQQEGQCVSLRYQHIKEIQYKCVYTGLGIHPSDIAYDPNNSELYIANTLSNDIYVIRP